VQNKSVLINKAVSSSQYTAGPAGAWSVTPISGYTFMAGSLSTVSGLTLLYSKNLLKMQHEFCISPSVVAMISADDP
jgi:hypothetical protein